MPMLASLSSETRQRQAVTGGARPTGVGSDEACRLRLVLGQPLKRQLKTAVVISVGMGGQAYALALAGRN